MDTSRLRGRFTSKSQKPQRVPISPEKIKSLFEAILKGKHLTFQSVDETEGGYYFVRFKDSGGSVFFSIIGTQSSEGGVDRGSLEDFYRDASEKGSDSSVFITDSFFTEDAKIFAAEKFMILVEGKELNHLLGEWEKLEVYKAFLSDKTDEEVVRYFESKRRKKRFHVPGEPEEIEAIEKRYSPVACYSILHVGKDIREKTRVYVDLAYGEIYKVNKGSLERIDIIRRIMALPLGTRKLLIDLLQSKEIDYKHIAGSDFDTLKRKKFIVTRSEEKNKGLFLAIVDEVLEGLKFSTHAASEMVMKPKSAKAMQKEQVTVFYRKMVASNLKIKKFDHNFDLEFHMDTSEPEKEFDSEEIIYNRVDVEKLLNAITEEQEDIHFQYMTYMPFYKCSYLSNRRYRYSRYMQPVFKANRKETRIVGGTVETIKLFIDTLPITFATFMFLGMLSVFLTEDMMSGIFTGNYIVDPLVGGIMGSIFLGPTLASGYIFGGELLDLGVSLLAVTSFIIAWTTIGILLIPMEIVSFGKKFTFLWNAIAFIFSIVLALIIVAFGGS